MRNRKLAAVVVAAVVVGAGAGCAATGPGESDSSPKTLTVAVSGVAAKWDPATFNWGYELQAQQAAYDSLVHAEPDGSFSPGLATEWEYTDPTTFTMRLRDGVTFTDGTPFDAEAVKANIEHDQATVGPKTLQIADIESVTVVSDLEVEMTLSQPNPTLPYVFSQAMGMMASPTAIADPDSLAATPVGAGPYVLDSTKTVVGDKYVFRKNPDYWDSAKVGYDTLVFRVLTDSSAIFNALKVGEINMAVGGGQTLDAAEAADLGVLEYPANTWALLFTDRAGTIVPALADVRVRQALNYAVNRAPIADAVVPGVATSQIVGPGGGAYDDSLDEYYSYDPGKAADLLADAGYANGFVLPVLSTPGADSVIQAIGADLAKVGVTVQIEDRAPLDYVAATQTTDFPAFIQPFAAAYTMIDARNYILPDSAQNPFTLENSEHVDLLNQAASESGDEQAATMEEFAASVTKEALFLPVLRASSYWYFDSTVTGVEPYLGQVVPYIYNWTPAS